MGWVVDQGSDFPPSITAHLKSWKTSALFRYDPSRLTTRGWNGYSADEESGSTSTSQQRAFRYLTPKKRLTPADLSPNLLCARAFHLVCSPLRCQEIVKDLLARRRALAEAGGGEGFLPRPLIIWEPVPDLCTPDELLNCTNTLPLVDVCSPNHAELASFMGEKPQDIAAAEAESDGRGVRRMVERHCEQLLASMPLKTYTLVVRAGANGCFIARNGGSRQKALATSKSKPQPKISIPAHHGPLHPSLTADLSALLMALQDDDGHIPIPEIEIDPGIEKWIPAYYGEGYAGEPKVVNPTGGGNTFLGALAVALARGKSIEEACVWGHVAASFAIEQVGLPVLTIDEKGNERWNGIGVGERLKDLFKRTNICVDETFDDADDTEWVTESEDE